MFSNLYNKGILGVLLSLFFSFLVFFSLGFAEENILPEDIQRIDSQATIIDSSGILSGSENISIGVISGSLSLSSSGSIGSGTDLTVVPPLDYSVYSYYSGTFTQDGITYGNSFYPNSRGFSKKIDGVQIYTYDEYLATKDTIGKKSNQKTTTLSTIQGTESMMSTMSISTDGLVASYPLYSNPDDTTGNRNGIPANVDWIAGSGAIFNGNDSFIDLLDPYVGNNSFVVSGWFLSNTLATLGDYNVMYRYSDILGYDTMRVYYGGYGTSALYWKYLTGDASDANNSFEIPNTFESNTWYHMIFELDDTNKKARFYLNGVLFAEQSFTGNLSKSNRDGPHKFSLGNRWWSPNEGWSGNIRDVQLYNRTLTSSEIQSLYVRGRISNTTNIPYVNPIFGFNSNITFLQNSGKDNHIVLSNEACRKQNADRGTAAVEATTIGDPVTLATGEFTYDNTLMSIPGVGLPYQLQIHYKNQSSYNGPLGFNWDHNYNQYLSSETNGNILYSNGQLGTFRFILSGSTFLRNEGLRATLIQSGGLYEIAYDNGNRTLFNSENRVSEIRDPYTNTLNFAYASGYLTTVTDTLGHTINYSYYDHNRLRAVTDFSGRTVDFHYYTDLTDSGSYYDLQDITLTNATGSTKTIRFEYSTGTDSADPLSHNITRLIDAKEQVYVVNTYDSGDRVATQKYGDGTLTYAYTLSGSAITQNTVHDKLGNRTDYTYDASGNNTAVRYYNPTETSSVLYTYDYNALGLMIREKRPRGNGYSYTYDTNGNLIQKRQKTNADAVDSASDLVTSSTYNARNEKLTETLPNNTQVIYTRDTKGNILTKTLSGAVNYLGASITGLTTTYTYLPSGLLQTETTPLGRLTQYNYTSGQLTALTRATGSLMSTGAFSYSSYGTILSSTDGDGYTKTYAYTPFDQLETLTTASGIVTTYAYDANNNKTGETRYLSGGLTMNSYFYYDSLDHITGSLVDVNSSQSVLTSYTYDANGNVTDKKIGNGATVHITYNEFSKPVEERILLVPGDTSKDIVTTYAYDTNNNLTSQTDPRGYTTSYTYDLYDRLIQTTDTQGTNTTATYNPDNTIDTTTISTSTGLILSKQKNLYDNFGKVVKVIRYLDPVNSLNPIETKYTYSKDNELLTTIDENGYTTTNTYDVRGNKLTTTDPLSNTMGATYNKRDLKVTEYLTQSSGTGAQLTTYTYDADGRVTSSKNTLNKIKTFEYNNLNAITKTKDEMNRTTDIERDYRGLMTKTTSYSGAESMVTTYNYDDRGNLLSIIDPMNHTMSYQYEGINRNTKTIYPDSKEITLTYDKNSNVITRTDPNGTTVTNTYDTLNHLTNRSISRGSGVGGVTSEIYTYDALGRLTSAGDNTNPTGTGSPTYTGTATINLTFSYDALNRLTSENQKPIGGSGYTLGYTYTLASDLLSVVFPDTKTQSYTYDALHRPLTTTYSGQILNTNTYSGILLNKSTYLNGKITNYTYDTLNRTKSINAGTSIFVPTYTYNDASDILSDATKSYVYDGYARLIGANVIAGGSSKEIISLDKSGNRIFYTLNTYTLNHSTNILDQYLTFTGGAIGTYTYDNNGNMKVQRGRTHIYDYNNRLIQINYGTGILSKYNYDVLGRRNIKVDSTTYSTSKSATNPDIIVYVYNGDNVLSEYKTYNVQIGGTGALVPLTLKKNYLNSIGTDSVLAYDNEEGISLTSTGKVTNRYYYHTNLQGSVIAISTGTGLVVQKYTYNAHGKPYIYSGSTLTPLSSYTGTLYRNTRLYTGREFENDTGYYYMRARYYSSDLGRFISRDPIGQNDQVNLYTYVKNSPLNYTDRNGRSCKSLSTWERFITWVGDIVDSVGPPQLYGPSEQDVKNPVIEKDIGITGEVTTIVVGFLTPGGKKEAGEKVLNDISKIVNGHAFDHLPEFEKFGIKTVDELEEFGKNIINSAIEKGNIKSLSKGRTMIWDDVTETVIFRDPMNKQGGGTIFKFNQEIARSYKNFMDYVGKQK